MASIINASSSGSGGIVQTADASGVLQLQTNGTVAVTVDTSANVGIGTTPTEKLTVNGNIKLGTSGTTWIYGPSTTGRSIISNSDSTAYMVLYGSSYGSSVDSFVQFTSGTSNTTILNANGALSLAGAVRTANGVGITFPATQSASSNGNTLDDYEEGTWTPTITASVSGTPTLGSYSASYVKIGGLVTVILNMAVTKNTASGYLNIGGLPFTVESGYYPQAAALTDFCSSQYSNPIVQFASSTSTCYFITGSGSTAAHDQASWSLWSASQFSIRFSATYRTSV